MILFFLIISFLKLSVISLSKVLQQSAEQSSQMMQENQFAQTTRLFHLGKYEEGLEKISTFISTYPEISMLYSNRALFYYQLKSNDKAIQDLQKAIKINYLNYIAYFNLFSIELRTGGMQQQAFQDLCCSLSVLYFLRGKYRKIQLDVQKSIKYCQNNIEAHILKAMMHLQNNKLKLAANQIEWALEYSPENIVLKRLRYFLHQKIGYLDLEDQNQSNPFQSKQRYRPQRYYRLECSLQTEEIMDLQKQIELKLLEFTQLYNDLNSLYGTVTQRVIVENDESGNGERSILSHISGIWDNGKKSQIFIHREPLMVDNNQKLQEKDSKQDHSSLKEDQQFLQNSYKNQTDYDEQKQPQNLCEINQQSYHQEIFTHNQSKDEIQQTKAHPEEQREQSCLIANEREDILHEDFQMNKSDHQNTPEMKDNKFTQENYEKTQNIQSQNQPQTGFQEKISTDQFLNDQLGPCINQIQLDIMLPEPLHAQNSNIIQYPEDYLQLEKNQSQKYIKVKQQNFEENVYVSEENFITQSQDTKNPQSYGQFLMKSNNNIQFHQSQVIHSQNPIKQLNQNIQNTLIDDLVSETQQRNKNTLEIQQKSENKNSIQEKLKLIKDKVVKSLDNSQKKIQLKESFENDEKSPEKKSEKSLQKVQVFSLYPYILPKKQIFFTYNNVEFLKKYKHSQLNEIYLVGVYHLSVPKYKMKTQPRKIDGTICNWNEKFAQMNLLEQPKCLKVTVFNKAKGMKARDQLLGEGEKEIIETGSVKLPVYDKKTLIGYIRFIINLI